jgi:phosphatidylserine decarboxylase
MPILKEGYPFVLAPLTAGLALVIVSRAGGPANLGAAVYGVSLWLGAALLLFALFCAFFFRDPGIEIRQGDNLILSPCDGTVLEIEEKESENIIRVFLSIFNVHLQRAPVDGTVTGVEHKDGAFLMAWDPQAQFRNEQNSITIENENGVFVVRQIAGFLARRCVAWAAAGDALKAGDKIGMIKFSSQVDLHLPKKVVIEVKAGDKVRAGLTVMGRL